MNFIKSKGYELSSIFIIAHHRREPLLIAICHDLADLFGRFYRRLPIPVECAAFNDHRKDQSKFIE